MKVAVASGKGGTGKTLISTNIGWLLARQGQRVTYVDADVEEPNGHLFLRPDIAESVRYSRPIPRLSNSTCSGCGDCQTFCRFNAIVALPDRILHFPELCSSCGGCVLACKEKFLIEVPREIGVIDKGTARTDSDHGVRFLAATLDVGEARATPLIRGLLDRVENKATVIVDAPPGTSCSVMEIVRDVDLVVLVTEPTPFGLHDLTLAVEMTRALAKPVVAVINRSDLGDESTKRYLQKESVELVAEIPYLTDVARAYARGQMAVQASPLFRRLVEPLARRLIEKGPV